MTFKGGSGAFLVLCKYIMRQTVLKWMKAPGTAGPKWVNKRAMGDWVKEGLGVAECQRVMQDIFSGKHDTALWKTFSWTPETFKTLNSAVAVQGFLEQSWDRQVGQGGSAFFSWSCPYLLHSIVVHTHAHMRITLCGCRQGMG